MIEITGASELTITVVADEVYKISYDTSTAVDIFNNTPDNIYVNSSGTFTDNDGVSNYLILPDGNAYNGFRPDISFGMSVYIKPTAAGTVSITRKGY